MNKELVVGSSYSERKIFTASEIVDYINIVGDDNPIHTDINVCKTHGFDKPVVHGMLLGGLFSKIIGTKFPGNGSLYIEQDIRFLFPVFIGEEITATIEVESIINLDKGIYRLKTYCENQNKQTVTDGYAVIKYCGGV